jgi:hypothetical protein
MSAAVTVGGPALAAVVVATAGADAATSPITAAAAAPSLAP